MSSILSKDESNYIKGIAIILMFTHHLFAFDSRIPDLSALIHVFDSFNIEKLIGVYGKLCVPIFLFVSGYGFSVINRIDQSYYFKKVMSIYKSVWLVFLIFIPLCIIVFDVPRVTLNVKFLFLNFFGLSSSFNGEWWFLLPYILLVMMTPLLQLGRNQTLTILVLSLLMHQISTLGENFPNPKYGLWGQFMFWQPSYVLGFICGVYSETISKVLAKKHMNFTVLVLTLVLVWFSRKYWGTEGLVFVTPLVVFSLKIMSDYTPSILKFIFQELGKKTLFMWLTHSFYCYHLAKNYIYSPHYTILILLNLIFVSYVTAVILEKVMFMIDDKSKRLFYKT